MISGQRVSELATLAPWVLARMQHAASPWTPGADRRPEQNPRSSASEWLRHTGRRRLLKSTGD